jgi:hypothetical protein
MKEGLKEHAAAVFVEVEEHFYGDGVGSFLSGLDLLKIQEQAARGA